MTFVGLNQEPGGRGLERRFATSRHSMISLTAGDRGTRHSLRRRLEGAALWVLMQVRGLNAPWYNAGITRAW